MNRAKFKLVEHLITNSPIAVKMEVQDTRTVESIINSLNVSCLLKVLVVSVPFSTKIRLIVKYQTEDVDGQRHVSKYSIKDTNNITDMLQNIDKMFNPELKIHVYETLIDTVPVFKSGYLHINENKVCTFTISRKELLTQKCHLRYPTLKLTSVNRDSYTNICELNLKDINESVSVVYHIDYNRHWHELDMGSSKIDKRRLRDYRTEWSKIVKNQ